MIKTFTSCIGTLLLLRGIASAQTIDPNIDIDIDIGLNDPAYGINIKTNFTGNGGWSRGYQISNEDGTKKFIALGSTGMLTNGKSSINFSYIGRDYDDTFMVFQPDGHIGVGINTVQNNEGWGRAFQIFGEPHAKHTVTTSSIESGLWSHNLGFYGAPAGGMVGTYTNHPFSVITNASSKLTILTDGNVGIGTTTPNERLAVNGNIRAREIKVETANWPDYVFQSDYDLKPLSEVAAFIKENGHLPEVPKAAVVEEDGVSLGEMNRILLKKVEELTLHLIENEKKRTEQNQAMEKMSEQIKMLELKGN